MVEREEMGVWVLARDEGVRLSLHLSFLPLVSVVGFVGAVGESLVGW